jgi:toxin ParE1/3/4
MAEIVFRLEASADLAAVFAQSVEQFGEQAAQNYLAGLQSAIMRLADFPQLGTVYPGIRPLIRYLSYRSHHVLYDYDGVTIWVVRILHHAMDVRGRV